MLIIIRNEYQLFIIDHLFILKKFTACYATVVAFIKRTLLT